MLNIKYVLLFLCNICFELRDSRNIKQVMLKISTDTHVGLHVNCLLRLFEFHGNRICQQMLLKPRSVKCCQNPFSGSRVLYADRGANRHAETNRCF
jgi:hypothetical protein